MGKQPLITTANVTACNKGLTNPVKCAMVYTWLRNHQFFILFTMRNILIHCKPSLLDQVKEMGLYYTHSNNGEVDVIVPDIETPDHIDGVYIDPDQYLCEFYELDYDQVNCVELA